MKTVETMRMPLPGAARIGFAALALLGKTALSPAHAASETVLYSFQGASAGDGANPFASLIHVKGTFYGTTYYGGAGNYGTVFSVTKTGAERVVYAFQGEPAGDGANPEASLINQDGTLYGTTYQGGPSGYSGTVFSVTAAGAESVLFSFQGTSGSLPCAGLINVGGTLYSTTLFGGAKSEGEVFSITRSGTEKVVYSFNDGGGRIDGINPYGGLLHVGGNLYGTTYNGGTDDEGTVFKVTKSRTEKVLYSFKAGNDGSRPFASLIKVGSTLYGTTLTGGANGYGTVFKVSKAGAERVIYTFQGQAAGDGSSPQGALLDVDGTLYGTTQGGGASGYGTVFKVTPAGAETVIYSFQGTSGDGANPQAGLIKVGGSLYGTTYKGGASGNGTVFAIKP
jgi:uncharacterized repeat protein (TIGR03803 family)